MSEARLDLFAHKQHAYDSIPPTSGALKEHVKRAAFQAGHICNQSTVCNPQLPSPGDWGWTKVDGTWVPHWTEASWQLLPNRVKNLPAVVVRYTVQGDAGALKLALVAQPCVNAPANITEFIGTSLTLNVFLDSKKYVKSGRH